MLCCHMEQIATFEELVETFEIIVNSVFADNIYSWGRFRVLEEFAVLFANRATHVDRVLLLTALNRRIESRRFWFRLLRFSLIVLHKFTEISCSQL